MTNNKQQTEINAVEYLAKVNQFAKENNTGKPKQQTAIEWLEKICNDRGYYLMSEYFEQAKAMHKTEHFNTWWHSISENEPISFDQYYNETYGGGEQ